MDGFDEARTELVTRVLAAAITTALLAACSEPAGTGSGPPGLSLISGDRQTGTAGRALARPLVVQVRDASGRVVAGASVSWESVSGNGSVPFGSGTDGRGLSSVTWILGVEGLQQTVRASLAFIGADSAPSPFPPVTFTATANGAATTLISVAGDGQVAANGDTLPVPLRVRAVTSTGAAVAGVRVHWTVGEGAVFPESSYTDALGEAAGSWVLGATLGQQTASATASLEGSPRAFTATVTPAANAFTWTAEQLPAISSCASPAWTGIWAASATEVFAVGTCGTIRHRNGPTWDLQNSGTTQHLRQAWGRSATDVFAVGDSGTVLHHDGVSWTAVADAPSANARAIWGTSAELFLVTWLPSPSFPFGIWHYDGAGWTLQHGRPCFLLAIWGNSGSDVFAVGSGTPLHYDGATWHDTGCSIIEPLSAVSGNGSGEVFVTGSFECQSVRVQCTSHDFVDQLAGNGWIRRLDRAPIRSFRGLWVGASSDIVVVGVNGLILHGDGSHWRPESSGTSADIVAISGTEPTGLWAITAGGLVLHGTRANAPAARAKGRD